MFSEDDEGLTLVASSSHNTPETDAFIAKFKNPKRVSKGSSLKLLMVCISKNTLPSAVQREKMVYSSIFVDIFYCLMSLSIHPYSLLHKVAEGAAHIYPRLAPTSEWDTCAAQAIVECAGGKVLQAEGGIPCE